jgi:hypothetical protein
LDDKILECKEYREMNRATIDQVIIDISHVVEQITDLERVESESLKGIAMNEMHMKDVDAELSKEIKIYNCNYAKSSEELTRRQNDLDACQFVLTENDYAYKLLQLKSKEFIDTVDDSNVDCEEARHSPW